VIKEKGRFISFLIDNGALQFGDFVLKSGDKSPFFVDLGRIRTGAALNYLGEVLARELHTRYPQCNVYFGPAYKGIALAAAAAMAAQRIFDRDPALTFDRKESKQHGEKGGYIGHAPQPGDHIVIIDDVVSSGGTKFDAIAALETRFGVRAAGVLVCLNRCRKRDLSQLKGLELHAVITLEDLVQYLDDRGDARAAALTEFHEG